MGSDGTEGRLERDVRGVRLVLLALAAGVVVFTGIAMTVARAGTVELARALALGVGMAAAAAVPLYLVLRRALHARIAARPADPAAGMPRELRSLAIVGAAACEGPALLATIGYLLTARAPFLVVPALGVVGILAQLPTARGVRERLEALRRRRS